MLSEAGPKLDHQDLCLYILKKKKKTRFKMILKLSRPVVVERLLEKFLQFYVCSCNAAPISHVTRFMQQPSVSLVGDLELWSRGLEGLTTGVFHASILPSCVSCLICKMISISFSCLFTIVLYENYKQVAHLKSRRKRSLVKLINTTNYLFSAFIRDSAH